MATPGELKTGVINHALLPLTVISQFVDVLSYVRLYAVGFASVAIIEAFNLIASSIGFGAPLAAAASVLILVFAHTLEHGTGGTWRTHSCSTLEHSRVLYAQGHSMARDTVRAVCPKGLTPGT